MCTIDNMYGSHECQSNIQILLQDFGKDSNPESRVSLSQTRSMWEELRSRKKIHLEISTDLHVLSHPEYEKMAIWMQSISSQVGAS
jgi:hypothetical protein